MYQALYRKWRPKNFDDVVGQPHITRTLKRQVMTDHPSHAYLFTGTRGTGKTTCAKLLARAVNCEHPVEGSPCGRCPACLGIESGSILDVVELDAASNNGVDQVRALREEAIYTPATVRRRVYIIDEVHMLSVGAFNALLKMLEEPPEYVVFILATTELHKVPATILSRCQRFSFKRIQPIDIQNRLLEIAQAEGIDLTEDGAGILARLADGALRDALSLLDQCAVSGNTVDKDAVLDALGLAGNTRTAHLMNAIRRGETAKALTELSELYAAGKDIRSILSELSALIRDLLLRQTTNNGASSLMTGGYDQTTMDVLSKGLSPQRLLHMLSLLQDAQGKLKNSTNRRTEAELCLIRLCDKTLDGSVLSLSERLSSLEKALSSGVLPAPAEGIQRPFADEPTEVGKQTLPAVAQPAEQEKGTALSAEALEVLEESAMGEELPKVQQAERRKEKESMRTPVQESQQTPMIAEVTMPSVMPAAPQAAQAATVQTATQPRRTPISRNKSRQPSGGGDPRFWQELIPAVLPNLPKSGGILQGYLSQKLVSGLFDGHALTLYVPDDGIRGWLSREENRRPIEQAAERRLGYAIRVETVLRQASGTQRGGESAVVYPFSVLQRPEPAPKLFEAVSTAPTQEQLMQELLSFAQNTGKGIVTIDEQ